MKIPCSHTLAAISATLLAITGSASNYSVKDLGPGTISDINESGHAVGNDVEGHGTFFDGTSVRVLTDLYSYYVMLDTPPYVEYRYNDQMTSLHLNNSDHLVGIADVYFPVGYSNPSHDGIPDIKTPGLGERTMAVNINDHDLVLAVGFSSPNFVLTSMEGHVYGGYDYFHALNNAGIAVGSVTPQSSTEAAVARACLASSNVVTRIDTRTPPQLAQNIGWSDALAINNQGHIVGQWVDDGTNKPSRAFVYKGNGVEDLGVLSGTNSVALDINDSDSIVGYFTSAPGTTRACLWFQGVGTDLNTLLPENSGWVLLKANAINNQGQIAGDGLYHGQPHGFMLSPGIDVRMSLIPADNGSYTLTLTGQSGGQYRLDFANSLAGTDPWTPLTTLTLSGPSGSYTDTAASGTTARYYRAVQVP